jgi:hypothetical protein
MIASLLSRHTFFISYRISRYPLLCQCRLLAWRWACCIFLLYCASLSIAVNSCRSLLGVRSTRMTLRYTTANLTRSVPVHYGFFISGQEFKPWKRFFLNFEPSSFGHNNCADQSSFDVTYTFKVDFLFVSESSPICRVPSYMTCGHAKTNAARPSNSCY